MFWVLAVVSAAWRAPAQVPEGVVGAPPSSAPAVMQFKRAQDLLAQADEKRDRGDAPAALGLYRETLDLYRQLRTRYPDWEPGVTDFRINYCDNQVQALARRQRLSADGPLPPVAADEAAAGAEAADPAAAALRALCVEAAELVRRNETRKAHDALMRALDMNPDHVTVRMLLGVIHCRHGEFENAMFLLKPLVEDFPDNARAHVLLGTAYFGLGRYLSAEEHLRRAVAADPNLMEAHYNISQVLMATNPPDKARARKHYRRSLDLGGNRDPVLEKELE